MWNLSNTTIDRCICLYKGKHDANGSSLVVIWLAITADDPFGGGVCPVSSPERWCLFQLQDDSDTFAILNPACPASCIMYSIPSDATLCTCRVPESASLPAIFSHFSSCEQQSTPTRCQTVCCTLKQNPLLFEAATSGKHTRVSLFPECSLPEF